MAKPTFRTAIRKNCLDCVGNSNQEVMLCTAPDCELYAFRFGRNPKATDPKYIKLSTDRYMRNGQEWIWTKSGKWEKA